MSLAPRPGFAFYNLTIIILNSFNTIFNTTSTQITKRIDVPQTYSVTLYESNYNSTAKKNVTVQPSNEILKK